MKILFLPIIVWSDKAVQRPHHLATLMAQDGHEVVWVNAHLTPPPERKPLSDNITEVRLPHAQYQLFKKNDLQTTMMANRLHKEKPDIIFVQASFWADVALELQKTTEALLIWDILDYIRAFKDLAPFQERLVAAERALSQKSTLVTATAQSLFPEGPERSRLLLPNACDYEHWNLERKPDGTVGFFGTKADWWAQEPIDALKKAGFKVELYGPGTEAGLTPYQELPSIARKWSCAIIPFACTPLSVHVDPVKFYEYMALGLPVVTTYLPGIAALAKRVPAPVRPYSIPAANPGLWPEAVTRQMETDGEGKVRLRKRWAARNTWKRRYAKLKEAIDGIS